MDMSREMISSAIVEGNVTIKSKRQLSQIIDTTLLKCYLQVHIFVQTCTFSETFNEVCLNYLYSTTMLNVFVDQRCSSGSTVEIKRQ